MNAYPNANEAKLRELLNEAQSDLDEFEDWKKAGKPSDQWHHRSSGTWARNTIKAIRAELRRRGLLKTKPKGK